MGNRNEQYKAEDERMEQNGHSDMCIIDSGNCGYHIL